MKNILFINDEPFLAEAISHRWSTVVTDDPTIIAGLFREGKKFDLIFLDYNMSSINGTEMIKRFYNEFKGSKIIINSGDRLGVEEMIKHLEAVGIIPYVSWCPDMAFIEGILGE